MPYIYKITSPTNKIYVGQTVDLIRRKSNYKRLNCKSQKKLYNSLKKYGWENHTFDIIEECNLEILGSREKYWKLFYNSIKKGLNIRLDEEKGGNLDKSICDKISKAKKGKKHSKEHNLNKSKALTGKAKSQQHRENISKGLKGKIVSKKTREKMSLNVKGRKYSEESKEKMSKSKLGKTHPRNEEWQKNLSDSIKKPIIQLDLNGNFIKEWNSSKDAAVGLNFKYASPITQCCKNKQKSYKGYKFKYK